MTSNPPTPDELRQAADVVHKTFEWIDDRYGSRFPILLEGDMPERGQ